MTDHDRLFKELLTVFTSEFLDLFLPEVAAYVKPGSLTLLDKEIFTDVTGGERHEVDLVARVEFRDRPAFFLIHFENQGRHQGVFPRRMFTYFARLYEKFGLPVYPVALLSYDQPLKPEPGVHQVEFPDWKVLDFRFRVIQLNNLNWRDFLSRPNPVAAALMAKMRIAPADRPRVKLECLRMLATLRLDPAKSRLIAGFVDTYLRLNGQELAQFRSEVDMILAPEKERVMELTTSWKEEGIQEATLKMVLRQLRRKFGGLGTDVESRVGLLPVEQLELLEESLLGFHRLGELIAWLDATPPTEGRVMELTTSWKEEGIREASLDMVLHQLRRRPGSLDAALETAVERLSLEQLRELSQALLDFKSVGDLTAWLDAHPPAAE